MPFKKLSFRCECGRSPSRISELGLTAEHHLVVGWWCTGCKRHIFIVKSLSDYWRECPGLSDEQPADAVQQVAITDAQFLRSMGIQLTEGADL